MLRGYLEDFFVGTWKNASWTLEELFVGHGRMLHGLGTVLPVKYQPNKQIKIRPIYPVEQAKNKVSAKYA